MTTSSSAPWAGEHLGRSFVGTHLEDGCPCPKAPCGLILRDTIRDDCPEHAWEQAKSMRQSHPARHCPSAPTTGSHPNTAA